MVPALDGARDELAPDKRVLANMHFRENMSVASTAHGLDKDKRRLYRRLEPIRNGIKRKLRKVGIIDREFGNFLE